MSVCSRCTYFYCFFSREILTSSFLTSDEPEEHSPPSISGERVLKWAVSHLCIMRRMGPEDWMRLVPEGEMKKKINTDGGTSNQSVAGEKAISKCGTVKSIK